MNNISDVGDISAIDPDINIIATYWLLARDVSPDQLTDCGALLRNYNYSRAQRIRAGYGKANARGPVFLALQLNKGLDIPADVFVLDLSQESSGAVAQITADWFNVVVDRSDDQAANTDQAGNSRLAAEQAKGRGFLRTMVDMVARLTGALGCDILSNSRPDAEVSYSTVAYLDPFLNDVRGTLQVVVHKSAIVSFTANVLSQVLCP